MEGGIRQERKFVWKRGGAMIMHASSSLIMGTIAGHQVLSHREILYLSSKV